MRFSRELLQTVKSGSLITIRGVHAHSCIMGNQGKMAGNLKICIRISPLLKKWNSIACIYQLFNFDSFRHKFISSRLGGNLIDFYNEGRISYYHFNVIATRTVSEKASENSICRLVCVAFSSPEPPDHAMWFILNWNTLDYLLPFQPLDLSQWGALHFQYGTSSLSKY